jgi:hypothetical protein
VRVSGAAQKRVENTPHVVLREPQKTVDSVPRDCQYKATGLFCGDLICLSRRRRAARNTQAFCWRIVSTIDPRHPVAMARALRVVAPDSYPAPAHSSLITG